MNLGCVWLRCMLKNIHWQGQLLASTPRSLPAHDKSLAAPCPAIPDADTNRTRNNHGCNNAHYDADIDAPITNR